MRAPGRWTRSESGLYVPDVVERQAIVQPGATDPAKHRDDKRPEWLQAIGAIASAVLAISSVVISMFAFSAQREALSQQAVSAQEEQDARSRESAAKVTWWIDLTDGQIAVRNASSGQLLLANFVYPNVSGKSAYVVLPGIPPCSVLSLPGRGAEAKRVGMPGDVPKSLTFYDGQGVWSLGLDGWLDRGKAADFDRSGKLVSLILGDKAIKTTHIEGCA
jgi:hypothetical protein